MKKKDEKGVKPAEYIAGIGASAGGLEALQEFLRLCLCQPGSVMW